MKAPNLIRRLHRISGLGVRPIAGACVREPGRTGEWEGGGHRAVLLVRDRTGYGHLGRILSQRHLIPDEFSVEGALLEWSEGLVVLSDESGEYRLVIADQFGDDRRVIELENPTFYYTPVWSPDGESIVFASRRDGSRSLYRKSVGGTGEVELVLASDIDMLPTSWSPDGRYLAFDQQGKGTGADIWILDLEGGPSAELFYQSEAEDGASFFSPDGRWLAYWSQESGRGEIYVTPFPGPGRRWQVSQDSGTWLQ